MVEPHYNELWNKRAVQQGIFMVPISYYHTLLLYYNPIIMMFHCLWIYTVFQNRILCKDHYQWYKHNNTNFQYKKKHQISIQLTFSQYLLGLGAIKNNWKSPIIFLFCDFSLICQSLYPLAPASSWAQII